MSKEDIASSRTAGMIRKAQVRKFLLDYVERNRHQKFKRVADSVYDEAEAALRAWCRRKADSLPSLGVTIK
jgi:hypothetical protein